MSNKNSKMIAVMVVVSFLILGMVIFVPKLVESETVVGAEESPTSEKTIKAKPKEKTIVTTIVKKKEKEQADDLRAKEEQVALSESEQLIEEFGFDPAKIVALKSARNGDPRAPETARQQARELPTVDELADPELYGQYEVRQQKKFLVSYVKASAQKVEELLGFLDENKEGIQNQDIADIEEEIVELKNIRERMLTENPDLLSEVAPESQQ